MDDMKVLPFWQRLLGTEHFVLYQQRDERFGAVYKLSTLSAEYGIIKVSKVR
jgi:hypothetical protein